MFSVSFPLCLYCLNTGISFLGANKLRQRQSYQLELNSGYFQQDTKQWGKIKTNSLPQPSMPPPSPTPFPPPPFPHCFPSFSSPVPFGAVESL